jgi:hypothetical protein
VEQPPRRPGDPASAGDSATDLFPHFGDRTAEYAPADHVAPKDQVDPNEASWAGAPIGDADEDMDLLAAVNHKPSRLTVILLAAILAAAAFGGGVLVQKHYGASSTAATGTGLPSGFPSFAGGGGFPGGAGGPSVTGTGGGGGGAGGGAATNTPSVVGTVVKVSGTTVTVKNFAGKTVTVKVPAGTTISLSSTLSLTGLKSGTTVSVVGTTAADGSVTASAVTARK